MCGAIRRTLKNKTRKDTQLKFYKVMAVPVSYTHLDVYKRQYGNNVPLKPWYCISSSDCS